jgi:hypothetical protein
MPGKNLVHWDAPAATFSKPVLSFSKTAAVFVRDWFIVGWRRSGGARHWIRHHFEQVNDGGELPGIEPVQQFDRMLFIVRALHRFLGCAVLSAVGSFDSSRV